MYCRRLHVIYLYIINELIVNMYVVYLCYDRSIGNLCRMLGSLLRCLVGNFARLFFVIASPLYISKNLYILQ